MEAADEGDCGRRKRKRVERGTTGSARCEADRRRSADQARGREVGLLRRRTAALPGDPGVATATRATVSASSKVNPNDSDDSPPSQESGRCGRAAATASGQLWQAGQAGAAGGGGCGAGWGRRRGTSPGPPGTSGRRQGPPPRSRRRPGSAQRRGGSRGTALGPRSEGEKREHLVTALARSSQDSTPLSQSSVRPSVSLGNGARQCSGGQWPSLRVRPSSACLPDDTPLLRCPSSSVSWAEPPTDRPTVRCVRSSLPARSPAFLPSFHPTRAARK